MKRGLCLLNLCTLVVFLFLPVAALPAIAAPAQVASVANVAMTMGPSRGRRRGWRRHIARWHKQARRFYNGGFQENDQFFHGNSNSETHLRYIGRNQGNSGNFGRNLGSNLDHSLNGGNQVISRYRSSQYRRTRQRFYGNSNSKNSILFRGLNQGNSGNSGVNRGINEDGSTNSGNQIVN